MPTMLIKVPRGVFVSEHRSVLVKKLNEAAAVAEQIPDDPKKQFLCWVLVDEVEPGSWTCGAVDVTSHVLPCMAMIYVPAGVLDDASRALYARLLHDAFMHALPKDETRKLVTSLVLQEVADGAWSANGTVWRLPDFAKAAGFAHLQAMPLAQ